LVRFAEADSRFDKRVEHCFEVEGRAADDFEHVGSSGLLLQRFAQFVQQASVLHRDHGLVGEGGGQLNLPLGKWTHGLALYDDDSDGGPFAKKWNAEQGTKAAEPLALEVRIFGIS